MNRIVKLSIFSLLLIAVASPAWACHFNSFYPLADCDGWSATGELSISDDPWADVSYVVRLFDDTGVVAEFTGTERFFEGTPSYSFGESWGLDLCGDYEAVGEFHLVSDRYTDDESFLITFTCECDPPPPTGCTGTPGYWKNHPDAWPVDMLTVGCVDYTQAELLEIFDAPTRGDATVKLFHHTVAAKLNVMTGAGDGIVDRIDDADEFLCDHPLFSRPGQPYKNMANAIKDDLVEYNESNPCGETVCDDAMAPQLMFLKAPTIESSWGSVKANFK